MITRDAQLQREQESDTQAAAEHLQALQEASRSGDTELPRASRFIARAYSTVKQHLEDAVAVKTRGVGGKYKNWLRNVPMDVAAVIAIQECISQCMRHKTARNKPANVQSLCSAIGRLYELEVRIREAESVNKFYMQKIHDQVKENCTTNRTHLRKLYNVAYDRIMKGELDSTLSNAESVSVGKYGLQACMDAGIIEQVRTLGSKGDMVYYQLTDEVTEFLTDYSASDTRFVTNTGTGVMLCPPDPWTNLQDGGFLSARRKLAFPLIKMHNIRKTERDRLRQEFTAEHMPMVFDCANYLQSIAYAVHSPTFDAIKRLWDSGGGVMGVPRKAQPKRPDCPFPPEWVATDAPESEQEVFLSWKRSAAKHYDTLRRWRGRVREIGGFLRISETLQDGLYFPVYADTRGRWYYRGQPNPQGSDIAKAVLHFEEKKPLGSRGLFWLKVAVATLYGFDKERAVVRAQWTDDNWDAIAGALDAPEDNPDVFGTDAPWCMFSAAWELREALRLPNPAEYKTGIAVAKDATCSGLQHFAAVLRDPIGGRYVNLFDEEFIGPKQDIYSKVATNALAAMKLDTESDDDSIAQIARWWISVGIPRGMAKKPVMTYVYGATLLGTTQHVESFVTEDMGLDFPDLGKSFAISQYCARKLFSGIANTVPAAADAMRWLRDKAKEQPVGKRMEWTSPTGFKVQHDYQDYDELRVAIKSCGIQKTIVREYNEDTKPVQMQNAIAPNFVHNLDGSHLTFTALRMRDSGLSMVAVHDSFGTHPCDVDTMDAHIRQSFVDMYTDYDILGSFMSDIGGVGEVPMRGTLDINRVLDSEFFFC